MKRALVPRLVVTACLIGAFVLVAVGATSAPPAVPDVATAYAAAQGGEPSIEVAADRIDYDSKAEVVRARGKVSVTYKDMRLTADSVDYMAKDDKAAAKGKVHLAMKQGEQDLVLDAEEVELNLGGRGFVAKSAAAPVRLARGDTLLEAQSVAYDSKTEATQARGSVKLTQTDLTVTCQSMDYDLKTQGLVATGSVAAVSGDVTSSADKLVFDGTARKATLTGGARTQSGRSVFTGGTIIIYLDDKKIEGSEGTKLTIAPGKG